jgi:hypothetical protein
LLSERYPKRTILFGCCACTEVHSAESTAHRTKHDLNRKIGVLEYWSDALIRSDPNAP